MLNALNNAQMPIGLPGLLNYSAQDAQAALGFVVSQTSYIEPQVYMTKYADIQYADLIPVDTSANPWSKSVTYYSGDMYGAARWINGNADDIPMAGTELTKFETMVYTAAIGYGWGLEEVRHAQMLGQNLPDMDARAARRAYEEMVDRVALQGDTLKNFKGLINNSGVTATAAPVGDWGGTGTSETTVLADVNYALTLIGTDTNWISLADTLLLSYEKLNYLATTGFDSKEGTLLSWLQKYNVYTQMTGQPLRIRAIRGLSTAGGSSTQRMIAYRRSPEVLKMHIPLPLFWLPVFQPNPLRFEVPGLFRIGGLDIRLPKEVHYVDGI